MKIKDGYILREVASSNIVVPIGATQMSFNGIMTLNVVATYIWRLLEDGALKEELVEKVIQEFDVDKETASRDIDIFLFKLKEKNIIED